MTFVRKLAAVAAASLVAVALAASAAGATRPDDRPIHGPGAIAVTSSPDAARPDDRATHGPGAIAPITPILSDSPSASGFDWIDAGIGGAATFGLALLGIGASALVLRHRRRAAFS